MRARSQFRVLLTILVLLSICATAQANTLRFGYLPVLDTLPLQVAVHEGLFAKHGLDVELIPFQSAMERETALMSGQLQGYYGDMLTALMSIQSGAPMKIVNVAYHTTPGQPIFGLVRGKDADPSKTLNTGISTASIIEYLLDSMQTLPEVQSLSLNRTEVKKIPIRMQLLLSGELDAAVLPEPLLSLAVSRGASVIVTDEQLDMPLTVIGLAGDYLDEREAFLAAYDNAVEMINKNPEDYRALMVKTCRIPPDLADTFPVYRLKKPALPTEQEVWRVQQWMLTRGLLNKMIDYKAVVAD